MIAFPSLACVDPRYSLWAKLAYAALPTFVTFRLAQAPRKDTQKDDRRGTHTVNFGQILRCTENPLWRDAHVVALREPSAAEITETRSLLAAHRAHRVSSFQLCGPQSSQGVQFPALEVMWTLPGD